MPAKDKSAYTFRVGDPAIVRDVPLQEVVNAGIIVQVTATRILFEGPSNVPGYTRRWAYKRKGTRWVQLKKDRYELEPSR